MCTSAKSILTLPGSLDGVKPPGDEVIEGAWPHAVCLHWTLGLWTSSQQPLRAVAAPPPWAKALRGARPPRARHVGTKNAAQGAIIINRGRRHSRARAVRRDTSSTTAPACPWRPPVRGPLILPRRTSTPEWRSPDPTHPATILVAEPSTIHARRQGALPIPPSRWSVKGVPRRLPDVLRLTARARPRRMAYGACRMSSSAT